MLFKIDTGSKEPLYKQLILQIDRALHDGRLHAGEQIPSMNELAAHLGISKETVKKAYGILVERGIIIPRHGKGFFAANLQDNPHPHILVIFDKLSVYKQTLFASFTQRLGNQAEITILLHNQSLDLLEYYLDQNLDQFDYYVVTPHFPLDEASQARAVKLLGRIPNRKLIMLDRLLPGYQGHFGAVYQDFENDIYDGLLQGLDHRPKEGCLRVITLPSSLYGAYIRQGITRFAKDYDVSVEFLTEAPETIGKGDTFLVLNSQLDAGLVQLARSIRAARLKVGQDVRIISYNDIELNEVVLDGLTTVSTDFQEMGNQAAEMILSRRLEKIHCPFRMIIRSTF